VVGTSRDRRGSVAVGANRAVRSAHSVAPVQVRAALPRRHAVRGTMPVGSAGSAPRRVHSIHPEPSGGIRRVEAHLPAQQPSPSEEARVPRAHEHPGRSFHHPQPSPSRSCQALGLTVVATATIERLRDGRDIAAVLRARPQRAGRLVVVHLRARATDRAVRVAVVASRKVGSAVDRNRAKRLLREAAKTIDWRPGTDVVLVARAACAGAELSSLRAELAELAARLDAVGERR
jgi:ribonuclease P protein component